MTTTASAALSGPALRGFMRNWATGVAVVTSYAARQPVGCTVNAFTSVSLRPPLLLISLGQGSRTLAAITTGNSFAVNLLSWQHRHLADRFAADIEDRFAGVPYQLVGEVPVIEGVMAAAVCSVTQVIPAADHRLVLGSPYWYVDRAPAGDPALFFAGRYQRINPG